jgi:hypothetical protein
MWLLLAREFSRLISACWKTSVRRIPAPYSARNPDCPE